MQAWQGELPRGCPDLQGRVLWSAALLLLAAFLLIALQSAEAQTDPPASGDWVVGDFTTVYNTTVHLRGDLIVANGGYLTLRNVTLRVYSSSTATRGIWVQSGGTLNMVDVDHDGETYGDNCYVARGSPSYGYTFVAEPGSELLVRYSIISGMGVRGSWGGLLVRTDDAIIEGSYILNGEAYSLKLESSNGTDVGSTVIMQSTAGLVIEGSHNVSVTSCTFRNCTGPGLSVRDSQDVAVSLSMIKNNSIGISISGSLNISVKESSVEDCGRGVAMTSSSWIVLDDLSVHRPTFEGLVIYPGCHNLTLSQLNVRTAGRSCLEADGVRDLLIYDSDFKMGSYYGIRILNGSRSLRFLGVSASYNTYDGIHIERAVGLKFNESGTSYNGYNGMFLVDSSDVVIQSMGFENNGYDGLNCDTVVNMTINWSMVILNRYSGINLQAGSNGLKLTHSWVRWNTRSGADLDSVNNVTFVDVNMSQNGDYGLRIDGGADNITVYDSVIWNNTSGAVRVDRSHAVLLDDVRMLRPSGQVAMLYSRAATDVMVTNSTLEGEARLLSYAEVTLVSCNFADVTPDADATSLLRFAHWVTARVLWPSLVPVPGVPVNATSVGDEVLAEAMTGATGETPLMVVPFEYHTGDAIAFLNPITFRTRQANEIAHNTTDVLADMLVVIILQDMVPPTAVAPDMTVELGSRATLDGSGSSDNGLVVQWLWTFDDGVGTVQLSGTRVNWTFTVLGDFTGELNVSDTVGLTNQTTFTIHVVDTTPPDVDPGGNITIDQGEQVSLDGTGTKDNDSTLLSTGTFRWLVHALNGTGLIGVREGPVEVWTFPEMGLYRVELEVTDQSGNVATGSLWVTVRDTTLPVVDLGPDIEVPQGYVLVPIYSVTDNDPDLDLANASRWVIRGPQGDEEITGLEYERELAVMGTYTVSLYVEDAAGNVGSDTRRVTVLDGTAPSVMVGPDRTVEMGAEVTLEATGTVDNDPGFPDGATFRWTVSGPQLDLTLNGPTATFTPPWVGEYTVTLRVTDAAGNTGTASMVVTSVDTAPPVHGDFSPSPLTLSDTGELTIKFNITDVGTGIDTDRVQMRTRMPSSGPWSDWIRVSIVSSGTRVSETMVLAFPEGDSNLQLRCWDLAGNGPVDSDVHLLRVNSRPVAKVLSPQDGAEYGETDEVILDASASSDVDGDQLYFRWRSSIDGLLGTNATVRAPPLSPGTHVMTVTVTDGVSGHEVVAEVTITVIPTPDTVDDEGGVPWWIVVVAVLLVLGSVYVVWDHLRRKRRVPPPPAADAGGWVETPGD